MIVSDGGAFSQIISAPLGPRGEKPRSAGLTMVIDKGLGFSTLTDILEVGAAYVDLFKFGFGTSPLYPEPILRRKLALLDEVEVLACPGGTLGEIAWLQGVYEAYLQRCKRIGFTAMEVSDGTIELPQMLGKRPSLAPRQSFLSLSLKLAKNSHTPWTSSAAPAVSLPIWTPDRIM
ncbi:hypothetical protein GCM10025858_33190 [Alicyclobacillus sacchari]|nr:hypothetical protein GCM10025858_33190 [Alicyclobacillus sacchari]